MDTASIIEQCAAGHRDAMATLYSTYSPRMFRLILRYVNDPAAAEDILHDGFIVILSHISEVRNPERLEYWMGTIMKNLAIQYLSRLEVAMILEEDDEPVDTPDISDILSYEELEIIINKLPEGYRTIFKLAVFENKSHKEIGRMLGIAPHSSSSQLTRAKAMLRRLIAERQSVLLLLLLLLLPFSTLLLIPTDTSETSFKESVSLSSLEPETTSISTRQEKESPLLISENRQSKPTESVASGQKYTYGFPSPTRSTKQSISTERNTSHVTESELLTDSDQSINNPPVNSISDTENLSTPESNQSAENKISDTISSDHTMTASETSTVLTSSKQNGWRIGVDYTVNSTTRRGWNSGTSNGRPSDMPAPDGPIVSDKPIVPETLHRQTNHKLPFIIGISISRQFISRLGLETGLNFTYMSSTTSVVSETRTYSESILKSYYLGIPLKLNYQLLSIDAISIYATGGAAIDIPVSHSVRHTYIIDGYTPPELSPRLQFSIFGGCGLNYHLSRNVSLYAEPSLRYYPSNGSSLPTFRHENPLELTIPIGLRFDW